MGYELENCVTQTWYREERQQVEAFFVADHLIAEPPVIHASPSGRYRLEVSKYTTEPGYWTYCRGMVYGKDGLIADVKRNHSGFHFGWAEGHTNGHDYLLCGEDYQGQTVIELDTTGRADYIAMSAKEGGAFCCTEYYPSPDHRFIVVGGCVWASSNEIIIYRFDEPMSLPWKQLKRVFEADATGWTEKGFKYHSSTEVRIYDGKLFDDLTQAEKEEMCVHPIGLAGALERRCLWVSESETLTLEEQIVPYK